MSESQKTMVCNSEKLQGFTKGKKYILNDNQMFNDNIEFVDFPPVAEHFVSEKEYGDLILQSDREKDREQFINGHEDLPSAYIYQYKVISDDEINKKFNLDTSSSEQLEMFLNTLGVDGFDIVKDHGIEGKLIFQKSLPNYIEMKRFVKDLEQRLTK